MPWYDSLFPGSGSAGGLSDEDKQKLANSGLLQAGLQILGNNSTPGVTPGQALSSGLLGGLNSVQQGSQSLIKQRGELANQQFQQAQQADQMDQMQRRRAIQDLALQFKKPDGTFDMPGYQQALAQQDPQAAMELHQNELRGQVLQAQAQKYTADARAKATREINSGGNVVTQEQQDDGTWKTIATAPRWQPGAGASGSSALAQQIALLKQYGATDEDIRAKLGLGTASGAANPNVVGPDAMNGLSPQDKATVQAIVDGRYPVPTGKQAMDPKWQSLISVANQVDPTLDAGSYKSRAAARQAFTSGKLGEQVKALNTLAGHLATLNDSLDKLDNSDIGILNKGYNLTAGLGNSSRASALGTYNTSAKAVGDEAAKVFAGGQSALGDRQEIAHGLDPSQPNAALRSTLQTYAELVQSRLSALQDQAGQSLGYGSKSLQIVTPKAQETFRKLSGGQGAQLSSPITVQSANNASDPLGIR